MSQHPQIPDVGQLQDEITVLREQLRLAYIGLMWLSQSGGSHPVQIEKSAEETLASMNKLGLKHNSTFKDLIQSGA